MKRKIKMKSSVILREAMNEILTTDLDMDQLRSFISRMDEENVSIVHRRVKIPSPLGLTLFMSSFEDLLSLRTRAYLIKDVDPEILRRLLGARSLATELDEEKLNEYYQSKVSTPNNANELLRLMDMGGGLERQLTHPLYSEKLKDIEFETLRGWVHELAESCLLYTSPSPRDRG